MLYGGDKLSLKSKIKNNKTFDNWFGFESGVDITNETKVLYRRNNVIKRIIFLSNLVFSGLFALLSIGERSNILLTIILFPLTFLVNMGLKKTINKAPDDHTTQLIASYIASFYIILLSIVIYLKLKFGSIVYLQECGYILLYYSLAICSLYQNKKMMKTIFQWTLIIVTILHFTVTYNILFSEAAKDIVELLKVIFVSDMGRDIWLRTFLLCLFMIVLYSIVSIGEFMQEERKKELIKRRQVQEDFTNVVTKIFDVTLDRASRSSDDIENIMTVSVMAGNLGRLLNLSEQEVIEIEQIAKIHVERQVNFISTSSGSEDEKFALLKEQTDLGSIIISRLQLERKCEDIIRSTFEGSNNDEFVKKMKKIQNEISSQIILICELYVTMRSIKSYKKAYNHKLTIQYMTDQFRVYFDGDIFEHFLRFKDQFEQIYENDKENTYEA